MAARPSATAPTPADKTAAPAVGTGVGMVLFPLGVGAEVTMVLYVDGTMGSSQCLDRSVLLIERCENAYQWSPCGSQPTDSVGDEPGPSVWSWS